MVTDFRRGLPKELEVLAQKISMTPLRTLASYACGAASFGAPKSDGSRARDSDAGWVYDWNADGKIDRAHFNVDGVEVDIGAVQTIDDPSKPKRLETVTLPHVVPGVNEPPVLQEVSDQCHRIDLLRAGVEAFLKPLDPLVRK